MEELRDLEWKKMLTELSDMLKLVYGNKLKSVILYGSFARGMAAEESDVGYRIYQQSNAVFTGK